MRIACLTTALALTPLAVGGAGAADAKKPQPRLRPLSMAPLTVHGSFFRARERVRLVVVTRDDQLTRRVRASRLGSFTARFDAVYMHPCSTDVTVTAVGAQGSRASLKVSAPGVCPPPP